MAYIATIMTCALTPADSLHGLYGMQNSAPEMTGAHLALELHRKMGGSLACANGRWCNEHPWYMHALTAAQRLSTHQ